MTTWEEIACEFETDKAYRDGNGHGYMEAYEALLSQRQVDSVLEVGVAGGGSLRLWQALFPAARVRGVDVHPDCAALDLGSIDVIIGDATDVFVLASLRAEGPFDVIVDDGSHDPVDICTTFFGLWRAIAPGGVYVIEDTYCERGNTGPWPDFVARTETPVPIVAQMIRRLAAEIAPAATVRVEYERFAIDHDLDCGPCLVIIEET